MTIARKVCYTLFVKSLGKRIIAAFGAAALLAAVVCFSACSRVTNKAYDMYGIFGTQSAVVAYADYGDSAQAANFDEAVTEIEAAFNEIDRAIGLNYADSDVSRFNRANAGERLEISKITYDLLVLAKDLYVYTDGAYDPSVGLLVDLWGFSPRFNDDDYSPTKPYDRAAADTLPEDKYIEAFRSLVGFDDVGLESTDGKYYVTKPSRTVTVDGTEYSMNIDLGGIGKGLAADKARELLIARGITEAYASVGTSSLALLANHKSADGAPEDNMWSVSLAHPRGGSPYLSVYAKNTAASTSGDYEHVYVIDGVEYCHIIDPSTGRPITNGVATVSLFGRTAAEGDALTTALCVMGLDKALGFINGKLTDCRAAMVCRLSDGDYGFLTNMDKAYYKLNGEDFPLVSRASDGRIEYVG